MEPLTLQLNHGIAFSADGKTLFASSANDVFAYSYDAEKGTAGKAKNIITGMDQSDHQTRTLLVPRQNSDMLLVSRGSNDNIDKDTVNEDSGRSQIRIFTIADLMDSDSAVQYTDGKILGWGLRNSVGVADHPTTGEIVRGVPRIYDFFLSNKRSGLSKTPLIT